MEREREREIERERERGRGVGLIRKNGTLGKMMKHGHNLWMSNIYQQLHLSRNCEYVTTVSMLIVFYVCLIKLLCLKKTLGIIFIMRDRALNV